MTETVDEGRDLFDTAALRERRTALHETTREALAAGDLATLRLVLNDQHPVDLAELLHLLPEDDRNRCLAQLGESLAARVLAESHPTTAAQVAGDLDDQVLSDIVGEMAPDDAADVLADLPDEHSERVLALMEDVGADEVRELMEHPEDSGGGIMTSRLVAVHEAVTVSQATEILRQWAHEEEVLAVFVTGGAGRLVGTVPLARMLLARPDALMGTLADRDPIAARTDMDQERIAELFTDYDLLALPVVDEAGTLVGQVTVDDIVDVIHQEATEDNLKMAATSSGEIEERSVFGVVRRRLPWLLVCLGGTMLSAEVMHLFAGVLSTLTPLVLFVPAIMAMGGNSGLQSTTVTVRGLATGVLHPDQARQAVWREVRVSLALGLPLGLLALLAAYAWTGGSPVAYCAGLAMCAAVMLSAVMGAVIPLAFRAVGIDPAVASGPLITTLNDAVSLLLYFGLAALLLRWVGA